MDEMGTGGADRAGGEGGPDREGGAGGRGETGDPLEDLGAEDEFYELPDEDYDESGEPHTALPGRVEAWRRRSATGAILTGFALGLQEVFEAKRDEPAVVMETSGDPPRDLPVEADFEYGRPKQSVVNVRPWLLPGNPGEANSAGAGTPDGDDRGDSTAGEVTGEEQA